MKNIFIKRSDIEWHIIDNILDKSIQKRICIFDGYYGYGKSVMLDHIKSRLENELVLNMNYSDSYFSSQNKLYDIMLDFININCIQKKVNGKRPLKVIDDIFKSLSIPITFNAEENTFTGDINPYESVRNALGKVRDYYSTQINETSIELAPRTFSNIVIETSSKLERPLFVLIDEFQNLDNESIIFLKYLLDSDLNIALIVTYEEALNVERKDDLRFFAENYFLDMTSNDYKISLKSFTFDDTKEFLREKKFEDGLIEKFASKIYDYTEGMPLLLSSICDNISSNNILDLSANLSLGDKLKANCESILQNLPDHTKRLIELIVLNQNEIDRAIIDDLYFELRFQSSFKEDFSLLSSMGILTNHGSLVSVSNNIVSIYFKDLISKQTYFDHKDNYELLEKLYRNTELDNLIHKYYSLANIYRALDLHDKMFDNLSKCVRLSMYQSSSIYSIDLLNSYLHDEVIDDENMVTRLKCQLIEVYFYNRKNIEACALFENLIENDFEDFYDDILISDTCYTVSRAYYYENRASEALRVIAIGIDHCDNVDSIYVDLKLLQAAVFDLDGLYEESYDCYNNLKKSHLLGNDLAVELRIKLRIQMISDDSKECIETLDSLVEELKSNQINKSYYIKFLNNLGIELLMDGQKRKAIRVLKDAQSEMENNYFLENHFIYNNLGLSYIMKGVKGYDKAEEYLKKASRFAISPLQKTYVALNQAILYSKMKKYEIAGEYFAKSMKLSKDTPDPIVASYLNFNLAKYYHETDKCELVINPLKKSFELPSKTQLHKLLKKRKQFADQYNLTDQLTDIPFSNRRQAFEDCDWELCELMFYD